MITDEGQDTNRETFLLPVFLVIDILYFINYSVGEKSENPKTQGYFHCQHIIDHLFIFILLYFNIYELLYLTVLNYRDRGQIRKSKMELMYLQYHLCENTIAV